MLKMKPQVLNKTCKCCNQKHVRIPDTARFSDDEVFGGWYWECSCNSTLFVPLVMPTEAQVDAFLDKAVRHAS